MLLLYAATQVPSTLLKLLEADPAVKTWAIDKLRITDLHHKAPAVRQIHKNPAESNMSVQQYLADGFNNPDAYPDVQVSIGKQDMHLHKWVVAKGCEVLAKRWGINWACHNDTLALDELMTCQECSITPSYSTTVMFFEFFYTWKARWPENVPKLESVLELLVMADACGVSYLHGEAEVVLRHSVTVENCCKLLEVADHHAAHQLRNFCLHSIASGFKLVSKAAGYATLSPNLVKEVEQAKEALRFSAA